MFLKCRKTVVVRDLLAYLKNRVEHRKLTSELRQVLAFDKNLLHFHSLFCLRENPTVHRK